MSSPIIDPKTNKPFKREDKIALSNHQSRAHTMSVRSPTNSKSIAPGLTPARLAAVLKSAQNGYAEDYFILAEEMEERDAHYRSVLSTRKLAVASIEPSVEAFSDEEHDLKLAHEIRALLRHPKMPECLFDLLDGLGKGIGLVEIIWNTKSTPWKPSAYEWVNPRFIRLDRETLSEIRLVDDLSVFEGVPLKPNGYIIHKPRMKSGHWLRNGLARLVAVMFMLKSFTVRDWWAFAEVFGMPIRIGKYHSNASTDDIRTLINAIATIASDAGAAIPESMQIDMVETAKGNGGDTLFENMAEWADRQISKAVLGQTMTTDDGSSQAQANVHNDVRKDIIRWDARQLANTLNEYLVKPFIDMNYGVQENYPRIEINIEDPEDLKAWSDALTPFIDRGLKVQSSEVSDKFGLGEPDKDAELLHPTNQLPQNELSLNRVQTAVKPGLSLALNARQSDLNSDDEINEFTEQALNEWQEISEPILGPILELLIASKDYDEFVSQLPVLAEKMDNTAFIEQLTRYCWQARALGDVTDE
ncbi:DUF935 domain-containing protein [Vibrio scophthalmi]|uniref:Portal protein n=1 Tax=Vibrio scophthalmi TaxID=45658 RepID=A0A1E3WMD6_9VIBR|nr:DUF935 domain-containing protein [Vibrio scophthalmi]ODS10934.1 Portal protein [Vibrio scophthalmi]